MSYCAEQRRSSDRRQNQEIALPPYQTASGQVFQDRRQHLDRRASSLRALVLEKPETALQALFRGGESSSLGNLPEALKIGNSRIDREHRELLHILSLMKNAATAQKTETFDELLSRLSNLLCRHFKEEELLMQQLGIPENMLKEHLAAHNQIIEEVAALYFGAINSNLPNADLIVGKVERWVLTHLVAFDLCLREYLHRQPIHALMH